MTRDLRPLSTGARLDRLRGALAQAGVPALLVTRLPNVRYLTGFTGSAAMLLVGPDVAVLTSDGRYRDQASEQLESAGVAARVEIAASVSAQGAALAAVAADAGWTGIGLEAHGVTWAQQRAMAEWFEGRELIACDPIVEELRMVKEPGEIDRIRAACAIADDALAEIAPLLAGGPTEIAFARALERAMVDRGATGNSFDPIVASGPNGAKPHARPSDRTIGEGELVVLDFGCVVDGYCSDMTRTMSVGEPSAEAQRMWEVVFAAQAAGRAAVGAGASCASVDAACRTIIDEAGWGDAFLHSTGHGIGLEVHEEPRVSSASTASLQPGFVVTVEPGVYLPEIGGVRIEDTVVVTETGSEPLTAFPKTLVVSR